MASPGKPLAYELALEQLKSSTSNFKCGICCRTLEDVYCISGCLHRFCGNCIHHSINEKHCQECPVCGNEIPTRNHVMKDTKYNLLVQKLLATKMHLKNYATKMDEKEAAARVIAWHDNKVEKKEAAMIARYNTKMKKKEAAIAQHDSSKTRGVSSRKKHGNSKKKFVPFENRLESLRRFKEVHGHCNVPTNYKDDPSLGRWVLTARYCYHQRQSGRAQKRVTIVMNEERIRKLEEIGFQWAVNKSGVVRSKMTFDDRLGHLLAFKEIYGHCDVPKEYEGGRFLGKWVNEFRNNYVLWQRGEKGYMAINEDRIRRLQEIGFQLTNSSLEGTFSQKVFDARIEELLKFKRVYGNCDVPYDYPSLGRWMYTVRRSYSSWLKGKKGYVIINQDRIKKLKEAGVRWID